MAANRPRSLQVFDPVLSNIARRYKPSGFIADQLLVDAPVQTLSAQYPIFDESYWFQNDVDNQVNDRAPAKEIDFTWSMDTYLCKEYALKVSITDLERQQAIAQLRLEQSKTELLTHRMNLAHEVRVANIMQSVDQGGKLASGWQAAAAAKWDVDTTDVEADIQLGVMKIYTATGLLPNVMVIPFPTAYAVAMNDKFRALLRYDATGKPVDFIKMGEGIIPSVIHGMKVIVPAGAQIDTAREGSVATHTEIWGEDVRLLYVDGNAGWGQPSVAYKLNHTNRRVTRWRETDPDLEYIRELERYDVKVVADKCGYVIRDTLT